MCILYRRCVGHNTQLFDYLLQPDDLLYIREYAGNTFVVDMRKWLLKELPHFNGAVIADVVFSSDRKRSCWLVRLLSAANCAKRTSSVAVHPDDGTQKFIQAGGRLWVELFQCPNINVRVLDQH